ncbi:MAG: DUF1569 domain-containing protein [Planctomycetota bacterium]
MSTIPLIPANRDAFVTRISAITTDSKRKWGRLEPAGMLAHLTYALEASMEEVPVKDVSTFFTRNIIKRLAFQTSFPLPKGKIKAPDEFTPPAKGTFDDERRRLIVTLDRFIETSERDLNRKTLHAFFGKLTMKFWQQVHGKHTDHHLEQFGV